METFKDFRAALITGLVLVLLSLGGYIYAGQDTRIETSEERIMKLTEKTTRLEVLMEQQVQINRDLQEILRTLADRDRFTLVKP